MPKSRNLIGSYPRERPRLRPELEEIFATEYLKNRRGESFVSSLGKFFEAWMHHKVASSRRLFPHTSIIDSLELGAGTLNHLRYVNELDNYDVVEPKVYLYENSVNFKRVRNFYADVGDISKSQKYDRIISIATLEHIEDLPTLLNESKERLSENGVFACAIPSEGGVLWGLAWRLTTGLEFRFRTGVSYCDVMRYEHLSTAEEISDLLSLNFGSISESTFGYGKHLSLYKYFECSDPK